MTSLYDIINTFSYPQDRTLTTTRVKVTDKLVTTGREKAVRSSFLITSKKLGDIWKVFELFVSVSIFETFV